MIRRENTEATGIDYETQALFWQNILASQQAVMRVNIQQAVLCDR